ncbi:MAG: alpha/beta fold hydrolase, partial [Thermomicrobiales bacterium]
MQQPDAHAPDAGFVTVNGTRLWCETAGDGPPLVLIHGSPLDARMWDAQVAAFAPQHRVIRYDLRGYGRSDPPTALPYRHEDDLAALLDHLGVARAAVLGLSMGGRVAVDFALASPARVSALVLAGSTISGFPWTEDLPALDAELRAAIAAGGLPAAREIVAARHWFQPSQRAHEVRVACLRQIADYSGWHWLHEDPVIAPDPPAYARLEALVAPTLIIVGDHDHPDVLAVAAALAARAPRA